MENLETPVGGRLPKPQSALAKFGRFALRHANDLHAILTEAARLCAHGLGVEYCKVLRYREAENDLLVVAGYGWKRNMVGRSIARADLTTPAGRAFVTGRPVITKDLSGTAHDFELPEIYAAHGILSSVNVVIPDESDRPYGVLEADTSAARDFKPHDAGFLAGFAGVLGEAAAAARRMAQLQATSAARGDALAESEMLAREFNHRVRNDLQFITQLLGRQAARTRDGSTRSAIENIAGKVLTLAQIYDHLLGAGLARTVDLGEYLNNLCRSVRMLKSADNDIDLICQVESLLVDLERATAIGLIVHELVANSFEHAFPSGSGRIGVMLSRDRKTREVVVAVTDNGVGWRIPQGGENHGEALVQKMTARLGGRAQMITGSGTRWEVRIPLLG